MFKSIFTKYITTFMLIIIASFVMLASIISSMMVNYYSDSSDSQIASAADSMKYLLEERLADYSDETLVDYVGNHSQEISAYFSALTKYDSDIALFVTDAEGRILASVGFRDPLFGSQPLPGSVMEPLRSGEPYLGGGDLQGLFAVKRSVKGIPLVNRGGTVIGAVFACSTTESINILMETTVKAIIMTCLWVLLAAWFAG